jgi:Xaa-Pro aminopeptidase
MNMDIFRERRERFMGLMEKGSVAVIKAAPVYLRNNDVDHPYRQDSDFYYLTGFEEPEALCVLNPAKEGERFVLFVRPRDPENETWYGRREGTEGAVKNFGADRAFTVDKIGEMLTQYLTNMPVLYFSLGIETDFDRKIINIVNSLRKEVRKGIFGPSRYIDLSVLMWEMRNIKQKDEIEFLKKSAQITAAAHMEAMHSAKPGKFEWEVQAVFEYGLFKRGVRRVGFETIVAAGDNATILHYIRNADMIRSGDLVLIDGGGEYNFMTADITRTFPANGKFTAAQRQIYDLVLKAQKAVIDKIKPGVTYQSLHETAINILTDGMLSLGILNGNSHEIIEKELGKKFFMHRTGHWLGMDVHDVGHYFKNGSSLALVPDQVFTVEPGLYIPLAAQEAPEQFRGIGVRIEDDVLVTENGCEVLTKEAPKEPEELENLLKHGN